jgi:hypothetical protein
MFLAGHRKTSAGLRFPDRRLKRFKGKQGNTAKRLEAPLRPSRGAARE